MTMAIDDDKHEKDRAKLERELKQIEHDLYKVVRKSKSQRHKRMEERVQRAELAALKMAAELGAARAKVEGDCDKTHTTASTWPDSTISRYSRVSMVDSDGRWIVPKPDRSIASSVVSGRRNSGISIDSRWKELSKPESVASAKSKQLRRRTERSSLGSQFNVDTEQTESGKQIRELLLTVGTLVSDADKRKRLMNHWEYKSTRLSMQCQGYEGNWDEEAKAIHDLDTWRRIQDERIASIVRGQPSQQSEHQFKFAKRASKDPTFRITLDRVAKESTCMTEQIHEEAKIEIMALEECLAMDEEDLRPKRELVAVRAILEFTEEEVDIYRLSCEACNDEITLVGPVDTDLKDVVDKHSDQVAKMVSKTQGKSILPNIFKRSKVKGKAQTNQPSQDPSPVRKSKSKNDAPHRHEAWSKDFAQHVCQHLKPKSRFKSITQSDAIEFFEKT